MSRFGVSAAFVVPGKVGGAEYGLYSLLQGLEIVLAPCDELLVFTNGLPLKLPSRRLQCVPVPSSSNNRFFLETLVLPHFTKQVDALLFPNYFTPPTLLTRPKITVIHDLQYLHFPENFSVQKRLWLRLAHETTLRYADIVVAISQFVREDILEHFGYRFADKIVVIPQPVAWTRFDHSEEAEVALSEPLIRRPYLLSVAAHYPHKNLETLIRAFALIHRVNADYRLILVGQLASELMGVARRPRLETLIDELGLSQDIIMTGPISDGILATLYRKAALFVLPSLFEGFGAPPVEALGLGVPVLTTRCGSLPEITLGLAQLVDNPLDPGELAYKALAIIDKPFKYIPRQESVDHLRSHYGHVRVASVFYELLTSLVRGIA